MVGSWKLSTYRSNVLSEYIIPPGLSGTIHDLCYMYQNQKSWTCLLTELEICVEDSNQGLNKASHVFMCHHLLDAPLFHSFQPLWLKMTSAVHTHALAHQNLCPSMLKFVPLHVKLCAQAHFCSEYDGVIQGTLHTNSKCKY